MIPCFLITFPFLGPLQLFQAVNSISRAFLESCLMPHPRMTGAAFDNMMTLASAVILFPVLEQRIKATLPVLHWHVFWRLNAVRWWCKSQNTNKQIQGDFISNNSSLPSDTMMNPATFGSTLGSTTESQYLIKDTSGLHQDNSYSCIS